MRLHNISYKWAECWAWEYCDCDGDHCGQAAKLRKLAAAGTFLLLLLLDDAVHCSRAYLIIFFVQNVYGTAKQYNIDNVKVRYDLIKSPAVAGDSVRRSAQITIMEKSLYVSRCATRNTKNSLYFWTMFFAVICSRYHLDHLLCGALCFFGLTQHT